ncbi:hypothetical protein K493DRAFT_304416 [Basidiobolus meristosporus CBS 931.73]|uniref:Uncharacterized protein n=1 Tax=Basidiobolus meristosporus CBS 931.73 TaxID=1314790 RepID=A0A1Y1XZ31_9FUNG|nr:hypothetical protein K493DRAFT_304416 [Basidiobolus meristosporus CBS 931.73]|eukprot:ORX91023.1 hypothetical protein K493DRAFT_304416 [Basidiobolus meristosporus CBS 931.73]
MSSSLTEPEKHHLRAVEKQVFAGQNIQRDLVNASSLSQGPTLSNFCIQQFQPITLMYAGTAPLGSLVHFLHPAHEAYFSDERNLFNGVFVTYGWGWTSVLYLPFVTIAFARLDIKEAGPFWFRWLLATLYWYFMTQSFAGPSVTESNGGEWAGGHDMSGHCMLLVHASLFLWEKLKFGWFNPRLNTRINRHLASKMLGIGLIAL